MTTIERRELILRCCAEAFDVSVAQILGRRRQKRIVEARHTAIVIARDQLNMVHDQLAEVFGNMNRSNITYCIDNVKSLYEVDKHFRQRYLHAVQLYSKRVNAGTVSEVERLAKENWELRQIIEKMKKRIGK